MKFFIQSVKKMEAERLQKVRCYNCGKVFDQGKVMVLQRLLHINKVLEGIDKETLEEGKYTKENLRVFIKQIETQFSKVKGIEAGEYQLIVNLQSLSKSIGTGREGDELLTFYNRYHFKPFNIKNPDDFTNTYQKLLEEEIGLKRACCKTHFQTPYILSRGLTNLVTVPGYESQWTESVTQSKINKEIEVKDVLNLEKAVEEDDKDEFAGLKPVTREGGGRKKREDDITKNKILIMPADVVGQGVEKDDIDLLKEKENVERKKRLILEKQRMIFEDLELLPIPKVNEVIYPDDVEVQPKMLQKVTIGEVNRKRGQLRGRPKGKKQE